MDPHKVHEVILEKVLAVQKLIDLEKNKLERALIEAQAMIDEETWKQHGRVALFLALKDAKMRSYGDCLILDAEEDEI
jgi:hypothetical protein